MAGSGRGFRYDFAVYDDRGQLTAVLEVKRRFGTDSSWAQAWYETFVSSMDRPVQMNVEVHPLVFEEIVGMWLQDVTQRGLPAGVDVGEGAGLLDIFRGGRVVEQDAA